MMASNAIMPTSGKGSASCLASAATIEANRSNCEETRGDAAASSAAQNISNCSQVSSDNENSSNHSTSWSTSSKRGAQKRLEAAQKLNLILPQQQQQQQQQPHLQQKNCLSTPIVITSDDLQPVPSQQQPLGQFYPSASQQMLFDSLAHQLNAQGGEVSLFTGLPSCTPTSADRLTSINPFFLHAANANTATSNQTENHPGSEPAHNGSDRMDQVRSSWLEQNGASAAAAAAAAHSALHQDQSVASKQGLATATTMANGYNSNNYNLQLNNNNHLVDQQRAKLTIVDLHAANAALSPIILSPALSFLGLSPEQEALLRYGGYVSPQQHPLAGRGFTQSDLNQLNHHHQVYHLNQMYHGQRAEPISTHHYSTHHHQQQINQHQGLQGHHQHFSQQQQQHQAYDRDHQQQQGRPNQKDLIQQTPTPLSTTAATNTTGQIRNQNQQVHQSRLNAGQQLVQQHHHHHHNNHQLQSSHINQIHQPNGALGVIDHARAQQQRHSGLIAKPTGNQLQGDQVRQTAGLVDGEALSRDTAGQQVSTIVDAQARSLQSTPVPRGEQLVRQQVMTTMSQEHTAPQQSGLLLMPAANMSACNDELVSAPTTSASNSFACNRRVAHPIRPAIILHEPTQARRANSPDSRRPIYQSRELEREPPAKSPKLAANFNLAMSSREASTTLSTRTNSVASNATSPIATDITNQTTCNDLSRSPVGRLANKEAPQRPNSSDNLVSSDQASGFVSEPSDPAAKSSGISSSNRGVGVKAKQRGLLKRAAAKDHQQAMISIQRDQGDSELPVKKKSRGGRKKKLVTHEEMLARKNRSKERNRVAARRCRQKRKQFLDELRDKIDQLHELNQSLRKENAMLKSELETIKRQHGADGLS